MDNSYYFSINRFSYPQIKIILMRNDLINLKKSKYVIYGFGKTGKSVKFFLKKNNIKSFFVWDDNWISKKANKKKTR